MSIVSLLLGVLAAAGLGELARRRGERLAFAVGLIGLVLFGLELRRAGYSPFPSWPADIPPGYACLAGGPPGAIVEIPYGRTQAHLYYQTAHGRPIFGGMVEDNPVFTPPEQRELLASNSFLSAMVALGRDPAAGETPTPEDQAAVGALGYRYVVLAHWPYVKSAPSGSIAPETTTILTRLRHRLKELLGPPVYIDADLTVFAPWGGPGPCDASAPLASEVHRPESRTQDRSDGVELRHD